MSLYNNIFVTLTMKLVIEMDKMLSMERKMLQSNADKNVTSCPFFSLFFRYRCGLHLHETRKHPAVRATVRKLHTLKAVRKSSNDTTRVQAASSSAGLGLFRHCGSLLGRRRSFPALRIVPRLVSVSSGTAGRLHCRIGVCKSKKRR